jgi:predicted lactoylglutathione lyase
MSIKSFVNLPVKDLKKSMAFFTGLGFTFNKQFTDDRAACLVVSDDIFYMLLKEEFFKSFNTREIADTSTAIESINSLFVDNRADVDVLADKALALGAKKNREPDDLGFMYSRSFIDLDGHHWEFGWMDPNHIEK